jgi:hypothetical protein
MTDLSGLLVLEFALPTWSRTHLAKCGAACFYQNGAVPSVSDRNSRGSYWQAASENSALAYSARFKEGKVSTRFGLDNSLLDELQN